MKHLNEATIQAFLDAELDDRAFERATQHFALCERCHKNLLKAETELLAVDSAFAPQTSSVVPSQRIWARIENEIDCLGASTNYGIVNAQTKSFWQQLRSFLTPPQIALAGALAAIIVASFFAVHVLQQTETAPIDVLTAEKVETVAPNLPSSDPIATVNSTPEISKVVAKKSNVNPARLDKVLYQPKKVNKLGVQKPKSSIPNPKSDEILPEEHDYLNSIAQLSKAVDASDEFVMRPSFRVDYERNLAVMDGAIFAMQKQVRKNPKDENARRILFASYQNKIELLNTVAEKSQMIASLR